jgi:hypothetical protein
MCSHRLAGFVSGVVSSNLTWMLRRFSGLRCCTFLRLLIVVLGLLRVLDVRAVPGCLWAQMCADALAAADAACLLLRALLPILFEGIKPLFKAHI